MRYPRGVSGFEFTLYTKLAMTQKPADSPNCGSWEACHPIICGAWNYIPSAHNRTDYFRYLKRLYASVQLLQSTSSTVGPPPPPPPAPGMPPPGIPPSGMPPPPAAWYTFIMMGLSPPSALPPLSSPCLHPRTYP